LAAQFDLIADLTGSKTYQNKSSPVVISCGFGLWGVSYLCP